MGVQFYGRQDFSDSPPTDYMNMFPQNHFGEILQMTSLKLPNSRDVETKIVEILKFYGINILMSKF